MSIDEMSDDTGIVAFTVDTVFTADAKLRTPMIMDSLRTIEIPMDWGKYLNSIAIGARVIPNPKARNLIGMEVDSIVFKADGETRVFSEHVFHVMAENGRTDEWKIRLKEVQRSDKNDIESFAVTKFWSDNPEVSSDSYLLAPNTFVKASGDYLEVVIMAPQVVFPFSLQFDAEVSEGAVILESSDTLSFNAKTDVHRLTVEASNGKLANWFVRVETGEYVYDNDIYSDSYLENVVIPEASLQVNYDSDAAKANVQRCIVDVDANEVVFEVKDTTQSALDFSLNLVWEKLANMEIIGYELGQDLEFQSLSDEHSFFLFDSYNALKKRWTVKLRAWKSSEAEVTRFRLLQQEPAEVEIAASAEINAEQGKITLDVSEGKEFFPLFITTDILVSDRAYLRGIDNGRVIKFETVDDKHTFEVVAEDGTVKQWTLECYYSGTVNTKAEVESFTIVGQETPDGKLMLNSVGRVDEAVGEIVVQVTGYVYDFPLKIKASMSTSRKATLTDGAFTSDDWLTFADTLATYPFEVTAQDGVTVKQWTIRLENRAAALSDEAELISFGYTGLSGGYVAGKAHIDQAAKKITISVTEKGTGALSFRSQLAVSEGATLKDIKNMGTVTFKDFSEVKTFHIESESKAVTNTWTLHVAYQPQLSNSDFERWEGLNFVGWGSANMNQSGISVSTTSQTSGPTGYCAKMVTGKTAGKIAAGSCFLGYFKFTGLSDALSNPKKMTYFGIPFTAKPISITFDYNYDNKGSDDTGSVQLDMINYVGDDFEYHTIGDEPGVTIINSAFRVPLTNTNGWKTITLPISYVESLPSTHIHLAFSSSFRGDEFIGTVGATLFVDNVKLGYE